MQNEKWKAILRQSGKKKKLGRRGLLTSGGSEQLELWN